MLTHASLMVAGPAAADAVARAKRLPGLGVGLHVVAVEGPAILPREEIPDLVDERGWFPSDQLRLGLRYGFHRPVRAQLRREIEAQFAAFAATGLPLSHADSHKHMHLHPFVAACMLRAGRAHGLTRVRVPTEPGGGALAAWSRVLRAQVRRAGVAAPDAVFGIADSGHMVLPRVLEILGRLPEGEVELYFHPATGRDALLDRLMPGYEHAAEFAALLSPAVAAATAAARARTPGSTAAYTRG